jgi:hypothetical protein
LTTLASLCHPVITGAISMYRRKSAWSNSAYSYSPSTTKVTIHWSNKSAAFAIKFCDTKHWNEMQIAIQYIKNFPYGERDYDPENKVWFLVEKHIPGLKTILEALPQYFEIDYQEKPTNQTNTHTFVPIDVWIEKFKSLTTFDVKDMEYSKAKMIYRKFCKVYHPDLNPQDDTKKLMSDLNECWNALELNHYKNKKEPEYVS